MVDITWNSPAQYGRQNHFYNDRMAGSVPVWKPSVEADKASATHSLTAPDTEPQGKAPSFGFGELLDIVNPLHHIPVVNNIYRNFTGDDISAVAQIAGGSLYGGALGGVASLINAAVHEHSGQSTGEAVRTAFRSEPVDFSMYEEARTAGMHRYHEKRGDDDRPRVDIQLAEKSEGRKQPRYNFNT